jgi:phenylacetate-CoA ligase
MAFDDHLHHLAPGYVAAPQWVKTIAGGGYAMLPPTLRFGPRYTRFVHEFGAGRVDPTYVAARLSETLCAALAHVPAFAAHRRLLADAQMAPLDVLQELPLTTKEQIKTSLHEYLATDQPASRRLRMFTGGSTSIPMTFYLHKGVTRAKEWAAFDAMARRFGTDGPGVVLALRGRTVSTAGDGRVWSYEPIKRHLICSSDHLEPRFMHQYVAALRRWKPSFIHAFPSALYPMIAWLRENGEEALLAQVKCVLLTSESVFGHHMAAFRSFFRCPVIVHYGHTERVLWANTLPDDERYHFWPHYGHLELVDPSGAPVTRPGQVGEIVGTSFDNRVMPLVRYRTGDYAMLARNPHPSLPDYPVLERIEGRLQEFVVCADHRLITVTTLGAAHFAQLEHCLRIQYEQFQPGRLKLRVVARQPLSDAEREQIAFAVREKTQGGCEVEVIEVGSIPLTERGKQQLLLQHLDTRQYLGAAMERVGASPVLPAVPAMPAPPAPAACPWERRGATSTRAPVVMVGTSLQTRGGISAMVRVLMAGGLFGLANVRYVVSHVEGATWRKLVYFARALTVVAQQIVTRHAALVHAHASSKGSFWRKSMVLALARAAGAKTVFHLHSGAFDEFASRGVGGPLLRRWIRRTMEASDAVIVLSAQRAEWVKTFAPASRVEVIANPVLTPEPMPSRGDAIDKGRVLFLGMICEAKGCYDLLRAWVDFRAVCPGWRLAVGGFGEVERFLAEAERLGVRDDIDYLGWVAGEQKDMELRRCDVSVLPSYKEGMPMSVLEAMAYGVPVLATPVGGVPDVIEADVHGLLVTPGDVAGLSAGLVRLATDPALRRRLGAAGRDRVIERNSADAVVGRLITLYGRVLGGGRQP